MQKSPEQKCSNVYFQRYIASLNHFRGNDCTLKRANIKKEQTMTPKLAPVAPKKARAPRKPKDPAAPKAKKPSVPRVRAVKQPKYTFEELNTRITEVNSSISLLVARRGSINDQLDALRKEKRSLLQKLKRLTGKTSVSDEWNETQSKDTDVTFLQVPRAQMLRSVVAGGRAQTAAGTAGRPQPVKKRTPYA
jgi:hypothetical protein